MGQALRRLRFLGKVSLPMSSAGCWSLCHACTPGESGFLPPPTHPQTQQIAAEGRWGQGPSAHHQSVPKWEEGPGSCHNKRLPSWPCFLWAVICVAGMAIFFFKFLFQLAMLPLASSVILRLPQPQPRGLDISQGKVPSCQDRCSWKLKLGTCHVASTLQSQEAEATSRASTLSFLWGGTSCKSCGMG